MRVFKIILILVLLFSISVFGQVSDSYLSPDTLEHTLEIPGSGDSMNWYWDPEDDSVVFQTEPDTLLGWFKSLTLDEKIDVYNYWKNDSVTYDTGYWINLDDDVFPKLTEQYN